MKSAVQLSEFEMAIHEMVLFLATLIVIVFQTIIFAEGSISSQIPKGCPAPVKADPTCGKF